MKSITCPHCTMSILLKPETNEYEMEAEERGVRAKELLEKILEKYRNKSRVARMIEVDRTLLWRMLNGDVKNTRPSTLKKIEALYNDIYLSPASVTELSSAKGSSGSSDSSGTGST